MKKEDIRNFLLLEQEKVKELITEHFSEMNFEYTTSKEKFTDLKSENKNVFLVKDGTIVAFSLRKES